MREWLPVFLAPRQPFAREVHVFDFFAGPGMDSRGELGSPLRVLHQLGKFHNLPGRARVDVHAHFFDASPRKIAALRAMVEEPGRCPEGISLDVRRLKFEEALHSCDKILRNRAAAKLLFIDQFGVAEVTPQVFRQLVTFPTCDFLFFLTSSTLHRFREHPAIRQKISRPRDYNHVHRAVLAYYRALLPDPAAFFLAPFSIKKGANVYGLIFGSAHRVGMDKFLQVAWRTDEINGEADFDINRDDARPGEPMLPLPSLQPTKLTAIQNGARSEASIGRDSRRSCGRASLLRPWCARAARGTSSRHPEEARINRHQLSRTSSRPLGYTPTDSPHSVVPTDVCHFAVC